MDELASKTHMSPSSFRQHVRNVAGMSPLQYLKHLRLQEARQVMMNETLNTGSASCEWAMKVRPNSAVNIAACSDNHRIAT
jgi:AraC-like DNA-binding protein